ncbi:nitroreductase family protein [Nocardioides sp. JS614]|uniref:nitroreductase family protein n=2 Tax=unclassified Nocardioides TaxID=2615069 RepID=UPI0023680366|nr:MULTISPECIES: nitroreductase family protein [unclassified Nocardioides]
MRTTGSPRYFTDEDVSDEVILQAIEAARFAPSGGNRQPVRWIVVRDGQIRRALAELYLPLWQRDMAAFLSGEMRSGAATLGPAVRAANDFAESFGNVPVILVACVVEADLHVHMKDSAGHPNFLGGSSVYTFVQNACLALRSLGVGATITTLICEREAEAAQLLGIPDGMRSACHIAVGYPAGGFPTTLTRLDVEALVSYDRYSDAPPPDL